MSETLTNPNETLSIINSVPENFSCKIEKLTPEWCKLFLSDELIESKRDDEYVQKIIELINNGEYFNNGSTIIISNEDKVLSGEEIMVAIVLSGKEIDHIVSRNVSSDAFSTVNVFAQRKTADIISIVQKRIGQDNENSKTISEMIKVILKFDQNGIYDEKKKIESVDVEDFYEENFIKINRIYEQFNIFHKHIEKNQDEGIIFPQRKHLYLALMYLFSFVDNKKNYDFFSLLYSRISKTEVENEAIYNARQKMITIHKNKGLIMDVKTSLKKRITESSLIYLLISAWNSWITQDKTIVIDFKRKIQPAFLKKNEENNLIKISNFVFKDDIKDHSSNFYVKKEIIRDVIYPEIDISVELITPEIAENYLLNNNMNRKAKDTVVNKYVNDMNNGNWIFNGTSIKISKTGQVLDAQHRLKACVRSGKSFYSVVVKGVDDDAFKTYDNEKPDSAKNILKKYLNYIENNNDINERYLLSIINNLYNYKNTVLTSDRNVSSEEKMLILKENDDLLVFCEKFKMNRNEYYPLKDKEALFFAYMIFNSDEELASDILHLMTEYSDEQTINNYNIQETKRQTDSFDRKQSKKNRQLEIKILNRFIVAWNCSKQNRQIDVSKLKQELNSKEKETKIIEIC